MNRHRKNSLLRYPLKFTRIIAATGFIVIAAALVQSLAQPPAPIVHTYASDNKKSGAALFHEKGCEHCHGIDGVGGDLGPSLSTVGKRLDKERIEHQIREGGAAMPAFGDVLQPDEIKDLVDFLHAKRKAPKQAASPKSGSSPTVKE